MRHLATLTAALLLFAACTKEEPTTEPQPQTAPPVSLAGTEWVGTCDDDFYVWDYPATIFWEFDFLTDSTGEIKLTAVIAAQPQDELTDPFRYSIEGTEVSVSCYAFGDEPLKFDYDTSARTFTLELYIGDGNTTIGGTTVFHLKGEEQPAFPVSTSWTARQQLPSGDTLMPVHWGLDFWEYGWGGQVNYCAGSTCAGVSLFWHYDSASHSGTVSIDGTRHPFTYDPATDILTLEYTTQIYGTTIPIGGTLQFYRDTTAESPQKHKKEKFEKHPHFLHPVGKIN